MARKFKCGHLKYMGKASKRNFLIVNEAFPVFNKIHNFESIACGTKFEHYKNDLENEGSEKEFLVFRRGFFEDHENEAERQLLTTLVSVTRKFKHS